MNITNTSTRFSHNKTKDTHSGCFLRYFVSVLLLIEPIFKEMLPEFISRGCFIAGFVACAWMFVCEKNFDLKSLGIGALWVLFGAMALVSHGLSGGSFKFDVVFFFSSTLLVFMGASNRRWITPMLHTLLILLSVHMVATILFYIQPDLYSTYIKPTFFSNARNAIGYQSALTTHYSNNGMYQAIGLICAWSFALWATGKKKAFFYALAAAFLFALLLTQKRAQLGFGLIAVVIAYGLKTKNMRVVKLGGFCIAAVALVLLVAAYNEGVAESLDRLFDTFSASSSLDETTSGRIELWEYALAGWGNHPIIGNGWGTYQYIWPNLITVSSYAHNEILQELYEVGIIGLGIFLICAGNSLNLAFRLVRATNRNKTSTEIKTALFFSFSYQMYALMYGCTTGVMLQSSSYLFPYLLAVAIGFSVSINYYSAYDRGIQCTKKEKNISIKYQRDLQCLASVK